MRRRYFPEFSVKEKVSAESSRHGRGSTAYQDAVIVRAAMNPA
jgi:hypothetical protein